MKNLRWIAAPLVVAALALGGCGDSDESLLGPTNGSESPDLARSAGGATGTVTVVHGVPGLTVDVYVNGTLTLPDFTPGTVTPALELPEGDYDLAVVPAGGIFPDEAVLTGSTFLPAGANASIAAHLTEDGSPTLSVFVNDTSETRRGRARVIIRHTAAAPTVDARIFRRIFPWFPVRTVKDLSNPNEAQTELFAGFVRAKLYPAGSYSSVYTSPYLTLRPGYTYVVYAWGALADGTLDVAVQAIPPVRKGDYAIAAAREL